MGQRGAPPPDAVVFGPVIYALTVGVLILLAGASCDQSGTAAPATNRAGGRESGQAVPPSPQKRPRATPPAVGPTLASLSPAATDLLVGMGAGDHLIAVSNFDADRDETRGLPRVGDYRTQDWEK